MSIFLSLRAALSLGGEAPAWECSLGHFLSLGKSSPCGRLWRCAHPQPLSPLQGGLAPRSEGKVRAWLRHQSGTTHVSHPRPACSSRGSKDSFSVEEAHLISLLWTAFPSLGKSGSWRSFSGAVSLELRWSSETQITWECKTTLIVLCSVLKL